MKRIISALVLISLIYPTRVTAEIGKSIDEFKESALAKTFNFLYDDSKVPDSASAYFGKQKFIFKTEDKRYSIGLIADKKGKNIILQNLSYPTTTNADLSEQDIACTLGFVNEASGKQIDTKVFMDFLIEAGRSGFNKKQQKFINNYLVSVVVYSNPVFQEWSISVRK